MRSEGVPDGERPTSQDGDASDSSLPLPAKPLPIPGDAVAPGFSDAGEDLMDGEAPSSDEQERIERDSGDP
jgi:hypothetical protein